MFTQNRFCRAVAQHDVTVCLCPSLTYVPVSLAGLKNAGRPCSHRMQRTPPPPPPGHRGTYRVPTSILTGATYSHQAAQFATASPPQRGAPYHTQPTAQFTPQACFPPQPPLFNPTTFHRANAFPSAHHHTPPSFATPTLPSDFVPSEHYHDCRAVYGYDLPKAVKATTYTQKLGIAGCPIETVPLLAVIRHSWSSYWLRYLCHGHEIFPVFHQAHIPSNARHGALFPTQSQQDRSRHSSLGTLPRSHPTHSQPNQKASIGGPC